MCIYIQDKAAGLYKHDNFIGYFHGGSDLQYYRCPQKSMWDVFSAMHDVLHLDSSPEPVLYLPLKLCVDLSYIKLPSKNFTDIHLMHQNDEASPLRAVILEVITLL